MEHKIERLIQQKVWEADGKPVAWRKDWVWQRVSLPTRRKSAMVFYYAAAAILIAGFTLSYLLQLNDQGLTETRIKSLELALRNKLKEQDQAHTIMMIPAIDNICVEANRLVSAPKRRRLISPPQLENKSIPEPRMISSLVENNPSTATVARVESEMKDQNLSELKEQIPVSRPVQAIIGYIPYQPKIIVASKKTKKSKIHFLKPAEAEQSSQIVESKWIIARIN